MRVRMGVPRPVAVPRRRSTTMSSLQCRVMRRLSCWLEALLQHIRIVTALSSSENTVIDRFELLDRYFSWAIPRVLLLVHIAAVSMMTCLIPFNRTINCTTLVILMMTGRHDELIHFKSLTLRHVSVSPYLSWTRKRLQSTAQGRGVIRRGMEELAGTVLHVVH